ncbi:MAG: helix-turn-helix domain-containing protein [Cumulibacter sp.]
MSRSGAGGIRESFVDGMRLLELPRSGADVREFEREWPLTVLYADRSRMRELLAPGIAAAGDRHIADAVVAFATNGYSISAAARTLHIHPNTARYRISRWRELTGWDVFTVHGLLSSLAALQDTDIPQPDLA